ncbi:ferrous iron transport protein B [Oscillospiraceae bacterium PP1C4]
MKTIALAGNPNCGKTTLFNRLTGANQHVGNWAGVTVERKEGFLSDRQARLVDLPGIYSLATYTLEERVARDFLLSGDADAVINLLDGTSIERGLYFTLQLCELGIHTVVAVGMMDEVRAGGGAIDCARLGELLGVPVTPIVARTGENTDTLLDTALDSRGAVPNLRYRLRLENAITQVSGIICDSVQCGERLRFYAIRLLEEDNSIPELLHLKPAQLELILKAREKLEADSGGMDTLTVVADERYRLIGDLLRQTVKPVQKNMKITDQIDAVALHKFWAFPIFLAVMGLMFTASFGSVGMALKKTMEWDLMQISRLMREGMMGMHVIQPVIDLVVSGILGGVGCVLTFLPQIALVFLFLTLLEECGYLARAAFLMDLPLRRLGLTGKSFIPMLMGFGCTTPAVMAARTLENERDRRMTILLTPYLSCSARFPIYALFAGTFFPRQQGIAVLLLYLLGILVAAANGVFLKKGPFRGPDTPFLMEFPPYRLPSLRNVLRNTWERCKDFLQKAGTLIFLMSVGIWLLQHFNVRLQFTADVEKSIFSLVGGWLAPVFKPLGFGCAEAAIALLAGLVSKEAVVSTLGVVCRAGGSSALLSSALSNLFTPLSAASFMVFSALYMPCISAFATMRRELHATKTAVYAVTVQTLIAYGTAMGVCQLGLLWVNFFG